MLRFYVICLLFFLCGSSVMSQQMYTHTYRDTTIPYIELNPSAYDFEYPIRANTLDSVNFDPPGDGRYLVATFGHRYLSSTSTKSDNHGGFDYWPDHVYNGITYDVNNLISLNCMCDGYITYVIHGPDSVMETLGTGRSVQVECDSSYQSFGNSIKINYRHLSALGTLALMADTASPGSIQISKGDTIGIIGESGLTSNVHLHMSTLTLHPLWGNAYVHTARLFDPFKSPGILQPLNRADIKLLRHWTDSALFRVIWPFNQTINQFEFINGSDTVVFNKEEAYDTGSANRDNHDCISGVDVYAYQFNGVLTAKTRYLNEMANMPARYPASPQRDTNLLYYGYPHIPIEHDSVSFVYDFMVYDLTPGFEMADFRVKLSDVWGYAVEGHFNTYGQNSATACDSYTWNNGVTYTASTSTATDTFLNAIGGDSIVTLDLTILNSSTGANVVTACNEYTWIDGITYTASTSNATHTLVNAVGCDSVVSLYLIVDSVNAAATQNGILLSADESGATYQWLQCPGMTPISGATGQSFTPLTNGDYAVVVSSLGCSDTSACLSVTNVGLADQSWDSELSISPNPSEGKYLIDLGAHHASVTVKVVDAQGKLVHQKTYQSIQQFELELAQPAGVYLMTLEAGDKQASLRLVKR